MASYLKRGPQRAPQVPADTDKWTYNLQAQAPDKGIWAPDASGMAVLYGAQEVCGRGSKGVVPCLLEGEEGGKGALRGGVHSVAKTPDDALDGT
jgi:hypothetical protein